MSDKLSSPGSSSGYSTQTRSNGSSGDESACLVVRRHPPTYVYSNESFDVEVHLVEASKTPSPPSDQAESTELVASLHHVNSGRECSSEAILITEPSRILLSRGSKVCKVKCMIRMDGIQRDQGAALELRFAPRSDLAPSSILGASTRPINIVNYKVKISLEGDWDRIWYKDEGGRDKSMELFVSIYDKDGQVRTGEQIPLKPILCYDVEDGTPTKVTNQDVMRTLGSSKIYIDKDTGKARIRFRVEDVSKNHQGQDFRLEVGPDPKAKMFKDVAPDYTPAVNVRSKRNKRSRSQAQGGRPPMARSSSPVVGQPRTVYGSPQNISFERSDLNAVRESMKGVINWADEVVNGLYPLQWQVVGYAQHPDGSSDFSRPYHNMPNPNGCISRILSMYSDSVRDQLRVLLHAVEEAGGSRLDDSPYIPMAGPLPTDQADPYVRSPQGGSMHFVRQGIPPQPGRGRPHIPDGSLPQYVQARGAMNNFPGQPPMPGYIEGPPVMQQPIQAQIQPPAQRRLDQQVIDATMEAEVAYVLAKQYKALRTGEHLGFPAYSTTKEILGFYRESKFHPLSRHRDDFGPMQVLEANEILEDAIAKKSEAVHDLKDWGSISNLLEHAMVYDWSKDIVNDPPEPSGN